MLKPAVAFAARSRTGHDGVGRIGRFEPVAVPPPPAIIGRDALPRVRFGGAQRRPTEKSHPRSGSPERGFWFKK